jgi:hypothetical protein
MLGGMEVKTMEKEPPNWLADLLRQDRDKLAEALRAVVVRLDADGVEHDPSEIDRALAIARAALKATKG